MYIGYKSRSNKYGIKLRGGGRGKLFFTTPECSQYLQKDERYQSETVFAYIPYNAPIIQLRLKSRPKLLKSFEKMTKMKMTVMSGVSDEIQMNV